MKLDQIATCILLTTVVGLPTSTTAVRGQQRPNAEIQVPKPKAACHCELVRRSINVTPEDCVDYCIWRWGWYWM